MKRLTLAALVLGTLATEASAEPQKIVGFRSDEVVLYSAPGQVVRTLTLEQAKAELSGVAVTKDKTTGFYSVLYNAEKFLLSPAQIKASPGQGTSDVCAKPTTPVVSRGQSGYGACQ